MSNCDLVVFSHLRWNFVFQRPQHLLSRFAKNQRVFYFEEPVFKEGTPSMELKIGTNGVCVVTPSHSKNLTEKQRYVAQRELIDRLFKDHEIEDFLLWYYTPMAIPFSDHLKPRSIIYDCMDELSMFHGAHPQLIEYESQLFDRADLVFTGGHSLYEYKKDKHHNIHPFPSSIEFEHFHSARSRPFVEPQDQKDILGPKIGYYGVIDERMDLELIDGIAKARPDWNLIMIGPTAKINPENLPHRSNIHYLGQKTYKDLPSYISHWDVALLPFARNDSTRFISPTKTPEYLAAGLPVVSTSISDVIRPYGEEGVVFIADSILDFIESINLSLKMRHHDSEWLERVDGLLSQMSWDTTWSQMTELVNSTLSRNHSQLSEAS